MERVLEEICLYDGKEKAIIIPFSFEIAGMEISPATHFTE